MLKSNGSATEANANQSTIYVGNLDPRVTDTLLHDIFATIGPIKNVKIITARRHSPHTGNNLSYGFVEFEERDAAETALKTMNGRKLFNYEIRLNWAQPSGQGKEDTANHFHVFVGDLAPEITSQDLSKAFAVFGTLSDAHVMWDSVSGKSRGFGFVAFRDKTDAEQAIATMNGEMLGARAIRCNWATQKGQTATPSPQPGQQLPYEVVLLQTPGHVTSVYVGNLAPETNENDLSVPFSQFGQIAEIRMQPDRGYAFVRMDTHEHAAAAIVQLQNVEINGRPAKLSWGKDRTAGGGNQQYWNGNQSNPNWHHNDQHLYSGRGARYHHYHHHRGGATASSHHHPSNAAPVLTGNDQNAQQLDTAAVAPSSLASLDPHASGTTQALASSNTQWSKQTVEPQMYNGGTSNI